MFCVFLDSLSWGMGLAHINFREETFSIVSIVFSFITSCKAESVNEMKTDIWYEFGSEGWSKFQDSRKIKRNLRLLLATGSPVFSPPIL